MGICCTAPGLFGNMLRGTRVIREYVAEHPGYLGIRLGHPGYLGIHKFSGHPGYLGLNLVSNAYPGYLE